MPTTHALTDRQQEILDFEGQWWKYPGAKDAEIRRRFDVSPTRYYQILNRLLEDPAALAHAPMVVRRLHRLRDQRTRQRSSARLQSLL